jgi:hypothetical protein
MMQRLMTTMKMKDVDDGHQLCNSATDTDVERMISMG